MKSLLLGGFLAAIPLGLLLPGCSGGATGLGSIFPTPTPKPSATATPVPTVSQTSNFTLGNRQRAILNTTRNGTAITGTIQILAPLAQTRVTSALTRSIKVGTFSITGVFTAPRGFNITVKDGSATLLTMIGQFPTATAAGNYSLTTFDGQTDSGVLPISGGPTATATPVPTATATPVPTATATPVPTGTTPPVGNVAVNLTFTPSSDSNFVQPGPLKGNAVFQLDSLAGFGVASVNSSANGALSLAVVPDLRAGEVIDLGDPGERFRAGNISQVSGFSANFFGPQSGTIALTGQTATKATFTFKDAVYGSNGGSSRGSVTINGTVIAPLKP